jgi:ribonuclease BN (tRNA processing enzyme)
MRIKVLGCYGGQLLGFHLTSFLVNDSILLDAGSPTEALTLGQQGKLNHIFLSHTHLDHIKDIAFLADNRSLKRMNNGDSSNCITIHSLQENLDTLKEHFLNDHIWPDFTMIPSKKNATLALHAIEPEETIEADGLKITAIKVNHPVPCTGFLLDQGDAQFIYSADTGATDRLWEVANEQPNLQGLIIDCSFANTYQRLADISGHLTPKRMAEELRKLDKFGEIPIYLYHMKPETLNVIQAEVDAEDIPHLRILTQVDELLI